MVLLILRRGFLVLVRFLVIRFNMFNMFLRFLIVDRFLMSDLLRGVGILFLMLFLVLLLLLKRILVYMLFVWFVCSYFLATRFSIASSCKCKIGDLKT